MSLDSGCSPAAGCIPESRPPSRILSKSMRAKSAAAEQPVGFSAATTPLEGAADDRGHVRT